ncbi:hypothetical protein K474DRAFT_1679302 [Panus rudis PR-1116 ss-1]|nr:hypothetical protein K474DRAFT_1679302 [Panus rudis PR-1116 ss-1]
MSWKQTLKFPLSQDQRAAESIFDLCISHVIPSFSDSAPTRISGILPQGSDSFIGPRFRIDISKKVRLGQNVTTTETTLAALVQLSNSFTPTALPRRSARLQKVPDSDPAHDRGEVDIGQLEFAVGTSCSNVMQRPVTSHPLKGSVRPPARIANWWTYQKLPARRSAEGRDTHTQMPHFADKVALYNAQTLDGRKGRQQIECTRCKEGDVSLWGFLEDVHKFLYETDRRFGEFIVKSYIKYCTCAGVQPCARKWNSDSDAIAVAVLSGAVKLKNRVYVKIIKPHTQIKGREKSPATLELTRLQLHGGLWISVLFSAGHAWSRTHDGSCTHSGERGGWGDALHKILDYANLDTQLATGAAADDMLHILRVRPGQTASIITNIWSKNYSIRRRSAHISDLRITRPGCNMTLMNEFKF